MLLKAAASADVLVLVDVCNSEEQQNIGFFQENQMHFFCQIFTAENNEMR